MSAVNWLVIRITELVLFSFQKWQKIQISKMKVFVFTIGTTLCAAVCYQLIFIKPYGIYLFQHSTVIILVLYSFDSCCQSAACQCVVKFMPVKSKDRERTRESRERERERETFYYRSPSKSLVFLQVSIQLIVNTSFKKTRHSRPILMASVICFRLTVSSLRS